MMLSILILLFLIGLFFWWGHQGAFSALLHLMSVIVAGAMALALWETIAFSLLGSGSQAALNAWGVALLAPFVLILGVLRVALMKFVPNNLHFADNINMIVGGAMGVVSGIIASGIIVIGLQYLPIPGPIAGYQQLDVDADGTVKRATGSQLWLPVDSWVGGFYGMLSNGALSASPASEYHGSFTRQAGLYRLGREYDPNLSLVAPPDAFKIAKVQIIEAREEHLPPHIKRKYAAGLDLTGKQLVVVDLEISHSRVLVGNDGVMRFPATQIRLVTKKGKTYGSAQFEHHAPIGAVRESRKEGALPDYFAVVDDTHYPFILLGQDETRTMSWVFAMPKDDEPAYLSVRRLRLPIEKIESRPLVEDKPAVDLAKLLGIPEGEAQDGKPKTPLEELLVMGQHIQKTEAIPMVLSRNRTAQLSYHDETGGVMSGTDRVPIQKGQIGKQAQIRTIHTPSQQVTWRIELTPEAARTLYNMYTAKGDADKDQDGIWIVTADDVKVLPIAFVFERPDEPKVQISMPGGGSVITLLKDIPINEVRDDKSLFLYFRVYEGGQPVGIGIGKHKLFEFPKPGEGGKSKDGDASTGDGD